MKQESVYGFFSELDSHQTAKAENKNAGSNAEFQIHRLEWLEDNNMIENDSPVQFTNFGIIWIKNGSGSVKIDMEDYNITDDMLVSLSPGQLLKMSNAKNLSGYYISFSVEFLLMAEGQWNGSFLDTFYERKIVSVICLDDAMQSELETVLGMINREFNKSGLMRIQVLKGLLKVFITYLSGCMLANEHWSLNDKDSEMVRKFMILIKKHFLTKKMVSDYASDLCVSPNYLNRIVKKITGFTASHHIQQLIVLEAKRQALYSSLSMKEVAYSLGFNDYAHFSKFFKNNSGMNFTCFRNQANLRA